MTAQSYTECLDAAGVPYRVEGNSSDNTITPLQQDDPEIYEATVACVDSQTQVGSGSNESGNEATRLIAQCLQDAGWAVSVVEDPDLVDGSGNPTVVYQVIDSQSDDPGYLSDKEDCTDRVLNDQVD